MKRLTKDRIYHLIDLEGQNIAYFENSKHSYDPDSEMYFVIEQCVKFRRNNLKLLNHLFQNNLNMAKRLLAEITDKQLEEIL